MKITLMPNDMDAPGCYRSLFPGRLLAEHGHTVKLPPNERVELDDGTFRFIFAMDEPLRNDTSELWAIQQRKERMWVDGGIDQLRNRGICIVMDVDDNYLETPEWNPAWVGLHPYKYGDTIRNRAQRRDKIIVLPDGKRAVANKGRRYSKVANQYNRNNMHEAMRKCDALTVSTPYLANLYETYAPEIHIVRNYLDWEIWKDVQPQFEVERERTRIGYLGVFSYRKGDLEVIKDVIPKFLKAHPEVDFVANSFPVHDFLGVPEGQRVEVGEYSFYPGDGGRYQVGEKTACLDIGLVPLAQGGMAEGKSHLKGMEYNGAGIPYLCSDTESYRYFTHEGRNGVTCHTDDDWYEALEELVTNDQRRREMGAYARGYAAGHTFQRNWKKWEKAYETILGGPEDSELRQLRSFARGAIAHGAVQKVKELTPLLEEAKAMDARIVVEVGSARGGTFWALSKVVRPDALLVSIDMPAGSPIDIRGGEDVYYGRDREAFRRFVLPTQRCVLIDGNSQTQETFERLIDTIGNEKIDVLFIDADHRYPGVRRDFELYSPLVRPGGLIAFHDVIPQNDKRSGVHLLWDELKKRNPSAKQFVTQDHWGHGSWGGIGVIHV